MINTLPAGHTYSNPRKAAARACPEWLANLDLDDVPMIVLEDPTMLADVDLDVSDLRGNAAEEWAAQLDAAGVPSDRSGVLILNERRARESRTTAPIRRPVTAPIPSWRVHRHDEPPARRSAWHRFAYPTHITPFREACRNAGLTLLVVVMLVAACHHLAR